ncbi:glycosyltransferase family 2 protein [Planctomonas sp. JC2975]|uniref:glycosyltransferase n=1 Tax=Planctomonas sp. JC2975 TaxID=2729626 RepID=UPI00147321D7|nr:glycosyltransferase family 2 protein [Planctomonas sp. JC2975]
MEQVTAVVVAFNRLEKLKTVIASIEAQTRRPDRLIVVDNASSDGTGEYLATVQSSLELDVLTLSENTGGAGGFSAGMARAYNLGADYVWIMDDDCYPNPDALRILIDGQRDAVEKLGPEVPFSCSLVLYTDGNICEMNNPETTWDWARLIASGSRSVMVRSCSFVSVLFPRWVIEKHGLPYSEYFIWFDDHEYTLRVTRACPGVQVLDSTVVHDMGDNKGVNFGLIDHKNAWKFRFGIRNEGSYRLHHESLASYLLFFARVQVVMLRGRVERRLRWSMTKQLFRAIGFNPRIAFPSRSSIG